MNYQSAKALKDAGFPENVNKGEFICPHGVANQSHATTCMFYYCPTLSELIEATPQIFKMIKRKDGWTASAIPRKGAPVPSKNLVMKGPTLKEAVAMLFIALNKKI